jgi:hypothetical protein
VIELAEVVRELRRELAAAMEAGRDEELRFELGPIELEVSVGVERTGGASGKVRFWVVELGGDAASTRSSTQRVMLTLQPRVTGSDAAPWISGRQGDRER